MFAGIFSSTEARLIPVLPSEREDAALLLRPVTRSIIRPGPVIKAAPLFPGHFLRRHPRSAHRHIATSTLVISICN